MVDWKLYIDSPQKRALDSCYGSLTKDNGWGHGYGTISGYGWGSGDCYGDGYGWGNGYGQGTGDGSGCGDYNDRSSTEW